MNKTSIPIKIRRAGKEDLPVIQEIFREAIDKSCGSDYSPPQIKAWQSRAADTKRWIGRIQSDYFLIAEIDGQIAGFGSSKNNYLDVLYVSPNHLRKGVARKLFNELIREMLRQGQREAFVDASITARPFFVKQGFQVEHENKVAIGGIELINYRMSKLL